MISSDIRCADRTLSSLATILVNRLVLNLREQVVNQLLPTTFETPGKIQAVLPVTIASFFPEEQIDGDSDSDTWNDYKSAC